MKIVEESEFLNDLVSYANNELSLKNLLKKYETDYRTMHNRITKLSETHPDIFNLIVKAHPYNEKNRKDIDFKALIIEILKSGMTVGEASQKYGISVRTIQRRAEKLSETEPELIKLYRKHTENNKKGKKNSARIREKICNLNREEIVISEINENRESNLLKFKEEFNKLVESGMSKNEAAKRLGLTSHSDAYKRIKQLERIQKENEITSKTNNFKEGLKIDINTNNTNKQYGEDETSANINQKGQEER